MEVSRRVVPGMNIRNKNKTNNGIQTRKALAEVNPRNVLGPVRNVQKPDNEIRKPVKAVRRLKPSESVKEPPVEAVRCIKPSESVKEPPVEKPKSSESEIDVGSLAEEIFAVQLLPDTVRDIDSEDALNPQLAAEYTNDIYRYMWSLENKYSIKKNHLECQSEITGKMRSILVDWLVQVHLRFRLLPETLYLTIFILDRYLQVQAVHRSRLQLIGVTAMFIASKYEEMYAPEVQDFVYITDKAYTKAEILRTEGTVLRKLEFNLGRPLPLHFLRRNSKAGQVDVIVHTLAKYLVEIMLPEYDFAHYSPSLMAAAASYLSMRLFDPSKSWNDTLVFYSNYTENEILPLVRRLCKLLLKAEESKLQAIRSKYASAKLLKISTNDELKSDLVVKLASEAVEE